MNYNIESAFKWKPFLYFVRDDIFIIGTYICRICDNNDMYNRYKQYREALANEDTEKIKTIYNKIILKCETLRNHIYGRNNPLKEFDKLSFSPEEILSIEKQYIERVAVYEKYIK